MVVDGDKTLFAIFEYIGLLNYGDSNFNDRPLPNHSRIKLAMNKTAEEVVTAIQATIKEEVKTEATNQIKDLKIEIIDRISSAKIQTILWVVGVGVLQLVAHYFLK